MKRILIVLILAFAYQLLYAQAPFSRGVNLTGWFQASSPRKIQFRKFTKKDFSDIKSLGCDVIRLPINLHAMTNGAPTTPLTRFSSHFSILPSTGLKT